MDHGIEQMFSRISRRYDRLNHLLSFGHDRRWRAMAIGRLEARHTRRVLDLCSGTGDFGIEVLKQHEHARVTFVDFSVPMLERAHRKLRKKPDWLERSALVVADALALPFPARSFDAAICAFGIRNISREAETLLEIKRVLRSGGACVILEFFRPATWPPRLFYWTVGTTLVPLAGWLVAGHLGAYRYLTRSILNHMRLDEFVFLMETIGFRRVEGDHIAGGIAGLVHGRLS
jgi:demethylmenaquinone methyltransferase/2-methoxy-6-polyprenyl-1,4-benzoquinol methylase